jgi:TIR domain
MNPNLTTIRVAMASTQSRGRGAGPGGGDHARGPVEVQPTPELNEFTAPAARDDSWKPRVFISYSKHDAEKRRQLALRLKVLATAGLVDAFFHDRMIQAGEDWDERIKRELEESDVIVFLVSAEMLATDYVAKVELARAMERRAERKAVVVPVILEPCPWEETKLKSPLALPEKGRPLTSYTPRANGWQVVSEGLKGLFTELRAKRSDGQR